MTAPGTAAVEIDRELLQRLRERRPEHSDRELVGERELVNRHC